MALPNQLNQNLVPGSTLASDIDLKFTQLITAIEDILGVPDVTNISAALFTIIAAGLKSVNLQDAAADPTVAGVLQRNAALLKWHNGTAAKQVAFTGDAPTVHEATHKSGGGDPFLSTDLLEAIVKRWQESGGPTTLLAGAIADGQVWKRSSTNVVGEAIATAGEYQANIATRLLETGPVWTAAGLTALTDAATIAVDLSTGFNFSVTLAGNRTLGNPTNTKAGQTGYFFISQDATGGRTLTLSANYKKASGSSFTLSTAANALDIIGYFVRDSTNIVLTGILRTVA